MASKTAIANRALSKLGESRVSNIQTDTNNQAKIINEMWDIVRDVLLASYPWNFAIVRTQLAKDSTSPAWGYNNRYTLPSDFLSLLEIKDNPEYKLESDSSGGQYILTNSGAPIYIRYIRRVENAGEYAPLFVEAFASRLAYEACETLTQSNTKKQLLAQDYEMNIKEAYAIDAIQEQPTELQESQWILSRDQYSDDIDYDA